VLRIFSVPNRGIGAVLSWTLFALGIVLYLQTSHTRHLENPEDRIVPTIQQLSAGFTHAALQPAEEDDSSELGEHPSFVQQLTHGMLWKDTVASGKRFLIVLVLMLPAVFLGLHMGAFPWVNRFFGRFVLFFDKIVALSILPILFIAFGIGEFAKVMLMVIGVAPTIIMDTLNLTKSVPNEQVVRGFTLGAKDCAVTYRMILPQIWPRVLNSIRLNLKSIVLFLFAGEMIASQDGLAYRIALMQRHMGMDVIIPYVLWTALLLFLIDLSLRLIIRWTNPWFKELA
jgi:NitT/TauT family transport system permease protein